MVRFVVVAIGLVIAACYSTPDYAGTRFRCGPDRRCPSGQDCVNDFCEAPDAIDASLSMRVRCDNATCNVGSVCCANSLIELFTCETTTNFCDFTTPCDFAEAKCPGSQFCCMDAPDASCQATCTRRICETDAQCVGSPNTHCCADANRDFPWKACQVASCP